ncbi:MAG: type II secretion system protein [Rickettsiales bacterium]
MLDSHAAKSGFSLVELSIVLVILGLLTGGILAGQSLIRAAELRAVTTEYSLYITAVQSFRDKYFALPGDMTNATAFWGDDNTNCADAAVTNGTPGTCNGDGNGQVIQAPAASTTGETFRFWQHLALAGLIEGTYTGQAGAGTLNPGADSILGTNVPRSKLSNSGWASFYWGNSAGDANTYAGDFGNLMVMGAAFSGNYPVNAALRPEEAWNIDTKVDDGKPATGKMWVRDSTGFGTATACTTSANATAYTGLYNLTNTAIACSPWFIKAY